MLGGLVAVTANCDAVDTWAAVVIGGLTPLWLELGDWINARYNIDDVIGAVPVHGACGVWGVIATAFFHVEHGLFYGGKVRFLGVQLLGLIVTFVWSGGLTFLWICAMNRWLRPIRIPPELEESGADGPEHAIVNLMTIPPEEVKKRGPAFSHEVEMMKKLQNFII